MRERVGLIDMSFMSKFSVSGAGAGALLNRLSTADVDGAAGRISYTQWLDDAGRMQADVTVAKLGDDRFLVVATDTAHRAVETWLARHRPATVHVQDVTGAYAQLNIQGPRARELLAALTAGDADVSDAALPFRGVADVPIGYARVLAARLTYVGELGYELFVPTEHALHGKRRGRCSAESPAPISAPALLTAAQSTSASSRQARLSGSRTLASRRSRVCAWRRRTGVRSESSELGEGRGGASAPPPIIAAAADYGHDMDNCDSLAEVCIRTPLHRMIVG